MNPRALFVLALCLIGIAVWIPSLFPEAETPKIQEEPGPSSDEETPDVLFAADPSSIREILIHRAETQDVVRLEPREDGHYQLTDPLVDRAEPALIGQLLMILSRTPAREMEAAWAARTDAELGIAAPRVDLEILLEDGSLYRLALGARHAGGACIPNSTSSRASGWGASGSSPPANFESVGPSRNSSASASRAINPSTGVGTTTSPKPRLSSNSLARSRFRASFLKSNSRGNVSPKTSTSALMKSYSSRSRTSFTKPASDSMFFKSKGKTCRASA